MHLPDKIKILFVLRSTHLLHNYKSIVESLCKRGHEVKIFFKSNKLKKKGEEEQVEYTEALKEFQKSLCDRAFTYEDIPKRSDLWRTLILLPARALLSYRRYIRAPNQSTYYRDRFVQYLPFWFRFFIAMPALKNFALSWLKSKSTGKFLRKIESWAPADPKIIKRIKEFSPDVLVASAGNLPAASVDIEYIKAGNALGVPTVVPVVSWDYLTTKGLINVFPTKLLVWNETQINEAVENHEIPKEKISITGAPVFDSWFSGLAPSMARELFFRSNDLNPANPAVVYLGSSHNMVKNETWLVGSLRKALDEKGMEKVQMIIRPHPLNYKYYANFNLHDCVILPKEGALPDTKSSLQLFYDTVFHSVAAVGVNTSAMIETIIVGKPMIAIFAEKYKKTQVETQHFKQLLDASALEIAKNPAEFAEIVKLLAAGQDNKVENRLTAVKKYIRPLGLERPAGDAAADEIEALAIKQK